jgi:cob(I)alamin adenosyltransferase
MARAITRGAERMVTAAEHANPILIRYLNRVSDHSFVSGRLPNANGAEDVLWVPGANRKIYE